jgi:hypothetical protein
MMEPKAIYVLCSTKGYILTNSEGRKRIYETLPKAKSVLKQFTKAVQKEVEIVEFRAYEIVEQGTTDE